jgi:hypothetical protein
MNRIDLHTHTTASDGTLTPPELVAAALQRQLTVLGIADHDSTEGIAPALAANRGHAMRIIPGIEVNCDVADGEVHILGYFKQIPSGAIQELLRMLREERRKRALGMVEKLAAVGAPIAFERVEQLARGGALGRPHIARALLEAGHVATIGEAFDRFIGRNGPAYFERYKLAPSEAVRAIRASGGVPVLAHPYYYDQYGALHRSVQPERLVPELKPAGLGGIEAHYFNYPTSAIVHLKKLAEQYHLIVTGGSDFHGAVKPDVQLGSVYVPPEVVEDLMRALDE